VPISPENMRRYPGGSTSSKEWKSIRADILERANHACEGSPEWPECRALNYEPHPETGSKVILTIAHLDHNPSSNDYSNLRAWCQRCHNKYDQPHRQKNAALTRRKRSNQIDMVDLIEDAQPSIMYAETARP